MGKHRANLIQQIIYFAVCGSTLLFTQSAQSFDLLNFDNEELSKELSYDFSLRLPEKDQLEKLKEPNQDYFTHVIPTLDNSGIGIGLFNCDAVSPNPDCLVASFLALDQASAIAQDAWQRHQLAATSITLSPEIKGYLLGGSHSETQNSLSSVTWLQDNQLYVVRFPSQKRQLGLYLAQSMVNSAPIKGQKTILLNQEPKHDELPSANFFENTEIDVKGTKLLRNWVTSLGSISPDLSVRVPRQIRDFKLNGRSDSTNDYVLNVEMLENGVKTSLYFCQTQSSECLIGTFSSSTSQSEKAQLIHAQHEQSGHTVTLSPDNIITLSEDSIKAHVLNSDDEFLTSMSWKQDGNIYGLEFPIAQRQNMLYTALDIVNGDYHSLEFDPTVREIRGVEIVGSTIFNNEKLKEELERARIECLLPEGEKQGELEIGKVQCLLPEGEKKEVDQSQLINLATGITQLYFKDGHITSGIRPPESFDDLRDDLVFPLEISEGEIRHLKIQYADDSRQSLNESYLRQRLEQSLPEYKPFKVNLLEDQLRLLGSDDNIAKIDAIIQPAYKDGLSDLLVTVTETSPWQTKFTTDNASPPRIGSERYGFTIKRRNLTGRGDSFSTSYFRSTTGGSNSLDFRYTLPINAKNGTLQFSISPENNEVTQGNFQDLGLRGETLRYGVQLRQPVIRSFNQELALSLRFTRQQGQTFVFTNQGTPFGIGPEEDGTSRTSVVTFGQEYFKRDDRGAWTINSQLNLGTGLFGVTSNSLPTPDGHFFSWLLQTQRLQRLNSGNLLILGADLQLTPHTLLSSQQFPLGGVRSLPGFRQNVRSGDNGFRLSVENRVTLTKTSKGQPQIQLAPFAYAGSVWNTAGNPNKFINNQRFLASVGVGGIWDMFLGIEGLKVRLDYAVPLIDLEDRGNNAQDEGFHFQMEYQTK